MSPQKHDICHYVALPYYETITRGIDMEHINLDEYIEAVHDTLQYWIDVHTKAEDWAEAWTDDLESLYEYSPIIQNAYFSVDLRDYVAKYAAAESVSEFVICPTCGMVEFASKAEDVCPDCESEYRDITEEELEQWFVDTDYPLSPDDSMLYRIMVQEVFPIYSEGVGYAIEPHIEEMKDCIAQLESGDPQEVLTAAVWANHICHVNGDVLNDYWRGEIDYDDISIIAEEGLAGYFEQNEIDEFIGITVAA
jgi:hypothetical protein